MGLNEIEDKDLKELISSNKPILLDFYSTTCPPCRKQIPVMEIMAQKYSDKVNFSKINIENNQEFLGEYGVTSIPTLILFDKGEIIKKVVGFHDEDALTDMVSAYL